MAHDLEEKMASSDMGSQSQQGGADQSSAVDQAKSEAGRLTQAARSRTMSYLEERKSLLAENVGGMASAARSAAEQFDEHGNRAVADYIQRAADGLERFSDAVRHRDISSLMGATAIVFVFSSARGSRSASCLRGSSEALPSGAKRNATDMRVAAAITREAPPPRVRTDGMLIRKA